MANEVVDLANLVAGEGFGGGQGEQREAHEFLFDGFPGGL